jgi:hypothetical protein
VDLVEHLSQDYSDGDGSVSTDSAGRGLLWSGMSSRFADGIRRALDAAKIEHVETTKEFGLLPTTTQTVSFIWVAVRDLDAARSVLDKVLADAGGEEQEAEIGPSDSARMNPFGLGRQIYPPDQFSSQFTPDAPFESPSLFESGTSADGSESDADIPDDYVEDFDPEDATTEVWSGDDAAMSDYLKLCLSGVGVGCLVQESDSGKLHVMVMPGAEKRAKQIVREIVEGEPSD